MLRPTEAIAKETWDYQFFNFKVAEFDLIPQFWAN